MTIILPAVRTRINPAYEPRALDGGGYSVCGVEIPPCSLDTAILWGGRWTQDPDALEYYFWRMADIWWNSGDRHRMAKHHWSIMIIRECCRNRYVGVGGAASGGKSYVLGAWGLFCWMCDPANTKILLTSTHLSGARDRIWGAVLQLIDDIPDPPCRIVDSVGLIAYMDHATGKSYSTYGLKLVSADKKQGKRKIGKMIGGKAPRVILIADELGEISESVQEAASSNLATNPHFQMVGLSNPASKYDPFGIFCTPKGGWDTVDVLNDMRWELQIGGVYVRLDAFDSPNFQLTDGDPVEGYPYLPSQRTIDEALESLGATPEEAAKSSGFLRMFRAVFNDSDGGETVYSVAELTKSESLNSRDLGAVTVLAGLDPSFSSNGDATVLKIGTLGYDAVGQHVLRFGEAVRIYEDVTDRSQPRNVQVAKKVVDECRKRGVKPENLAVDATGAGAPFCDILQMAFDSDSFLRVQFGGAASDRKIKNDSKTTGRDRYRNRASELFFIGKQFLLGRQLAGISSDMVKQMTSRMFKTHKGVKGLVLQVEPKEEYKKRMGESPDETDASFILLEGARERHFFVPQDPVKVVEKAALPDDPWAPISLRALNGRPRRTMGDLDACAMGHEPHLA
jgi:hypothetical protein